MKKIFLAMFLFASTLYAVGDNLQTITVNGEVLTGKTVISITFSGDNVNLHFDDNTEQAYDMELVKIAFDSTTGIKGVTVADMHGIVDGKLVVDGLTDGSVVKVVDMKGNVVTTCKAEGTTANVSVDGLSSGVYIMTAGGKAMKFMKK